MPRLLGAVDMDGCRSLVSLGQRNGNSSVIWTMKRRDDVHVDVEKE
jgi:hypothetical protein